MTRRVKSKINLAAADDYADDALERGVWAATLEAESLTVENLSNPGTGRVYRRGGVSHRASAPGQTPAPDTSTLRKSVRVELVRVATGLIGKVIVSAAHALPLEIGTERMAARPFLSRVVSEHAARLRATFDRFAR